MPMLLCKLVVLSVLLCSIFTIHSAKVMVSLNGKHVARTRLWRCTQAGAEIRRTADFLPPFLYVEARNFSSVLLPTRAC